VRIFTLSRLDQFIHNMPGRGAVGVPHAEINDIFPALTRLRLEFIDDIENVRRQPLYAGKFFVL
jgi:hypothetical protein